MNNNVTLLDKPDNRPIETFEEAVKELRYIAKDVLLEKGSQVHSNITHQIVFDLLTEIS